MTKNGRIEYLDYMKAIAIILVIVDHALAYSGGFTDFGNPLCHVIYLLIESVHVPAFFIIAGFFVKRKPLGQYFKGKFFRVFLPFLVFTTLKLVYSGFISDEFSHSSDTFNRFFDAYVLGRLYWFLFTVSIMYALAPLFWSRKGIRAAAGVSVILIGINIFTAVTDIQLFPLTITAFGRYIENPYFQADILIKFLPYFLIGMIIRQYREKFLEFMDRNRKVLLPLATAIALGISFYLFEARIENPFTTKFPLSLALVYLLWMLSRRLPSGITVLNKVSEYTLQILLFDSFFKVILFKLAAYITVPNAAIALILCAVNIALSCLCCSVIRKIPGVKILFGL